MVAPPSPSGGAGKWSLASSCLDEGESFSDKALKRGDDEKKERKKDEIVVKS